MNMLAKFNPFGKTETLGLSRSSPRMDPLREMEELVRNMQRTFPAWLARADESISIADWAPSVDIGENDREFVIKAELPEVKKEDIKVNVGDGTLSISGERNVEKEEKGTKFHRVERAYGRFERCFTMPEESDPEKITSEYKDGVLTVHLPKNPGAKAHTHAIPVS